MLRPNTLIARVVALGILGVLLLAGNQFVLQPLLNTYQENQKTIVQSNERLRSYRSVVAEHRIMAEQLEELQSLETAESPYYIDGTSDALAAAELQDLVTETVEFAGGDIRSVQALTAIDVANGLSLRKAAVTLRFTTDIGGLAEALFNLETGDPLLFVERLQVSVNRNLDRREEQNEARPLDVDLDIFGFVRRQES